MGSPPGVLSYVAVQIRVIPGSAMACFTYLTIIAGGTALSIELLFINHSHLGSGGFGVLG